MNYCQHFSVLFPVKAQRQGPSLRAVSPSNVSPDWLLSKSHILGIFLKKNNFIFWEFGIHGVYSHHVHSLTPPSNSPLSPSPHLKLMTSSLLMLSICRYVCVYTRKLLSSFSVMPVCDHFNFHIISSLTYNFVKFLFQFFFYFLTMSIWMHGVHRTLKKASEPLELELTSLIRH